MLLCIYSPLSIHSCYNIVSLVHCEPAVDFIPRPLPAFQHSREKWEDLVHDGMQVTFHLEPTCMAWNNLIVCGSDFCCLAYPMCFYCLSISFDHDSTIMRNPMKSTSGCFKCTWPHGWDHHVALHTWPSHSFCPFLQGVLQSCTNPTSGWCGKGCQGGTPWINSNHI